MTRRLTLAQAAEVDLDETFDYIAEDNVQAAEKYIRELLGVASVYLEHPILGLHDPELSAMFDCEVRSYRYRNHRCYYVYTDSELRIIRALHGARDKDKAFKTEE